MNRAAGTDTVDIVVWSRPMTTVSNVQDVRLAVGAVKAHSTAFRTNLFLQDHALNEIIRAGNLSVAESDGTLLLIARESEFDRLYFAVAAPDLLGNVLVAAPVAERGTLIADVVGPKSEVSACREAFEEAGFSRRACLHRLQCVIKEPSTLAEPRVDVEVARIEDAAEILQMQLGNSRGGLLTKSTCLARESERPRSEEGRER